MPDKGIKGKKNCRPVYFMNIDVKPQQILANWTQQRIKLIMHHDEMRWIPGMQDYFHIWNQLI